MVISDDGETVVSGIALPGDEELLLAVGALDRRAASFARASVGNSRAANMAMIAMTTSNSMRVNAKVRKGASGALPLAGAAEDQIRACWQGSCTY